MSGFGIYRAFFNNKGLTDQWDDYEDLISDSLKVELKQLINEVLDEREHLKQLEGPYDFPEDDSDEWLYRGTY